MKKLYFTILLLLPSLLFAQTWISMEGSSDVMSGGTHEITTSSSASTDIAFSIHYDGPADSTRWRVTRLMIADPEGWQNNLCWGHSTDMFGGTCYSSSQMNTNPWTTGPTAAFWVEVGQTPEEYGKLKSTIKPADGVSGLGHYRYYLSFDGSNYIDSVDIKFDYVLDVEEVEPLSVAIIPNPASDYIQVNLNGVASANMKMVNVLGSEVLNQQVISSSVFDISSFRNGVYIMTFTAPGSKAIVRKVIIKH
ncbi:MAG: T9SS type A sorting domain-containing protein [Crocinitomicaceae bacterium]